MVPRPIPGRLPRHLSVGRRKANRVHLRCPRCRGAAQRESHPRRTRGFDLDSCLPHTRCGSHIAWRYGMYRQVELRNCRCGTSVRYSDRASPISRRSLSAPIGASKRTASDTCAATSRATAGACFVCMKRRMQNRYVSPRLSATCPTSAFGGRRFTHNSNILGGQSLGLEPVSARLAHSLVSPRGRLTEPTPAIQPGRRERVSHCPEPTWPRPREKPESGRSVEFCGPQALRWATAATALQQPKSTGLVRNCAAPYSSATRRRSSSP